MTPFLLGVCESGVECQYLEIQNITSLGWYQQHFATLSRFRIPAVRAERSIRNVCMRMASNGLVILSSSPPRQFATTRSLSASPLPSPGDLFDRKSKFFGTDKVSENLSNHKNFSFATAAGLLKKPSAATTAIPEPITNETGSIERGETVNVCKSSLLDVNSKSVGTTAVKAKTRKRKSDGAVKDDSALTGSKRVRKPKADQASDTSTGRSNAKGTTSDITVTKGGKLPRKPRAKKADDSAQSKIVSRNISKPSVKRTKKVVKETPEEEIDGLGLTEAVKRKTTWTPPASKTKLLSDFGFTDLTGDNTVDLATPDTSTEAVAAFGDLIANFGFTSNQRQGTTTKTGNGASISIAKKKLIELVSTANSPSTVSPPKKAPKKKPRTLTELATAAYAEAPSTDEPAPILHFLNSDATHIAKPARKSRSKSPVKGTRQAPILLSPESAMKQVANQDFVFGTSSQLAREESPTLLKDLHDAIQASLIQSDPVEVPEEAAAARARSNLWNAAFRDSNGDLLSRGSVPSPETPVQPLTSTTLGSPRNETREPISESEDAFLPTSAQPDTVASPNTTRDAVASNLKQEYSPKKTILASQVQAKPPVKQKGPEIPNFTTYTTAQLAKEVASYGFKPVKSRTGMITLLEKCWEGKHKAALQSLDVNSTKKPSKTQGKTQLDDVQSPKRPRGRPRKDSLVTKSPVTKPVSSRARKLSTPKGSNGSKSRATKVTETKDSVEEISDSDVLLTPSPPRRRGSQVGRPPLPLQLSADDLGSSPSRSSSQEQKVLFEHVTRAITTASPTKDPQNPTWHEKILLYDPIVLEDLAAWLNTGGLGKVGWDGEISALEVKKWCESNSICCLWKINLKGGVRSRY